MTRTLDRKTTRILLSVMSAAFALSVIGCAAVGPDYAPPETALPDSWHTTLDRSLSHHPADAESVALWWERFEDPVLTHLIEGALGGSPDIQEAVARVQEARARRGLSRTDLYPSLDATGNAAFSGEIENEVKETSLGAGQGDEGTIRQFSAGLDAGWELDLFGGVRRSVEAAEADLQATQADLRDAWVTLAAETALTYIEVRTSQVRLAVARANLEAQQETLALTSARRDAGLESELAVHQARYSVESTRARIPSLESGLETALNGLAVLQGRAPGTLHSILDDIGIVPTPAKDVAVGIPADVLRQRPDIRSAERELAAQTARIGEATADLYPKVRISGSIGVETLDLNHLGTTAVWPFGYGISIEWPVFDAGRIRRNIDVQKALQEQAMARYKGAVLSALEEVENALSAYALERDRLDTLHRAASAAQEAVDLAQIQYEAGLIDFGDVLEAQRSLLGFQDEVAESEGTVAADVVRLYKALGGGWQAMTWTEGLEENPPSTEEKQG